MRTALCGIVSSKIIGEISPQRKPEWYLITSAEVEEIKNGLIDIGNHESGAGRIRIWELILIIDKVQDRLA
jgi:hypothetical protein